MIQIYHNEKLKIKWHGTAALNMYEYMHYAVYTGRHGCYCTVEAVDLYSKFASIKKQHMRAVVFEFFLENLRSKDSVTRFRPPIFWLKRLYLGPTGINRIKLFRKLFCFCKDIRLQRSKIMCHVDVRIVNLGCPRGQRLRWHSHTGRNNSEFQVKSTVNQSAKFQTLYKTAVI